MVSINVAIIITLLKIINSNNFQIMTFFRIRVIPNFNYHIHADTSDFDAYDEPWFLFDPKFI